MKRFTKKENIHGGKGPIYFEYLHSDSELMGMCSMYAQVTMPPGSSLGYHVHEGNAESYYILSGEGRYVAGKGDVKTEAPVYKGDVTYTPSGEGHSIENTSDEDLVFMALIINNEKRDA